MAATQATIKYLMSKFESVSKDVLDDPVCPCCYVEYEKSPAEGVEAERPIKTRCNHIFGHLCLEQWLSNNNCPLCRRKLFELPDPPQAASTMVITGDDVVGIVRQTRRTIQALTRRFGTEGLMESAAGPNFDDLRITIECFGFDRHILLLGQLPLAAEGHWLGLYQELYEAGASLAEPSRGGMFAAPDLQIIPETGERLDLWQNRELFEEIRFRGAFNYPGMRLFFRSMPDILIHWTLRQSGICWRFSQDAWTSSDGIVLWSRSGAGVYRTVG